MSDSSDKSDKKCPCGGCAPDEDVITEANKIAEDIVCLMEQKGYHPGLESFMALSALLGANFRSLVGIGGADPALLTLFVLEKLGIPIQNVLKNLIPVPTPKTQKTDKTSN